MEIPLYQVDGWKGDIMTKYVTEIYVQFSDDELFSESREKLLGILKKARGECDMYVYIKSTKVCYQHEYCFDETKLNLLIDAFGEENVKTIAKPVRVKTNSDFKDCCGNCIERIADALERIADALEESRNERDY